ncbi:hypothetical protein [Nocardiopsis suaedae]|uniref:DUF805 domain-containing protein n=1 Tax=Nocardiopsis suaedae TaxID=3018444 RepID=A0ABT4TW80_9ACTN|nr:hypothetical protein [Nocardiopsis suaedae]MDA2808964.1 hypothetical protein [Nocardiopsis suaedae]
MAAQMPTQLKAARIILFAFTGLSFIGAAGTLASWGASSNAMLAAVTFFFVIPGVASLALGLLLKRGGHLVFWPYMLFCAFIALIALSNAQETARWVIQMLWPIALVVLVLMKPSRAYMFRR